MVIAVGIGARLVSLLRNVDFTADHRMHARGPGSVIELDRAEQVAVIGHGHGRHLLLDRDLHQLVDLAGPVEQGVIRVAMQMDERHDDTFRGGGTLSFCHRGRTQGMAGTGFVVLTG
jgi:hypothetical protein